MKKNSLFLIVFVWFTQQKGDLKIVEFLVEKGVNVNQATDDGKTPLWIVAKVKMILI